MNGRITAIGFVLLLSVSVAAGAGLVTAQDSQPTVSAGSDQVSSGSQGAVRITLSEAPDGLQTYQVTIELDDPRVANITGARPGEIRGDGFSVVSQSSSSITLRAADFNDKVQSGAREVNLGTVVFNETFGGRSDVTVTVDTLRDDNNSVFEASTSSGELIISGGTPRPTATATPDTATPTQTTTATPSPTTSAGTTAVTSGGDATTADSGTVTTAGDTPTPPQETIPPADGSSNDGGDDGNGGDGTTATTTSSSSGPGFTAGLALLALAGVALLARRQG